MASITLLIPCYNAARYLPRLAESVRALTQPFDRVLCYDDGSSDDTVAVALALGFEVIRGGENRGVAHTRNRLAAAATSEWIHFHDADDLLGSDFLAALAPACDSRHDVVSCDADWVDEQVRSLMIAWRYDPDELRRAPFPYLIRRGLSLNNTIIRLASWTAIGGCDESLTMWEDSDVHIRLARHGARFHHVSAVHSIALRRSNSLSEDHSRSWACRVTALERYADGPRADEVSSVLAEEAERAAMALAVLGEKAATRRAVALCRRLGVQPPTTQHALFRLLKTFVPTYTMLRLQAWRRRAGP